MTPHADADSPLSDDADRLPAPPRPTFSAKPPRLLVVGAGSRGNAYARATEGASNGIIAAVAEPIAYKRKRLGERYIWGKSGPSEGQQFEDWSDFVTWELKRRTKAASGEDVPEGVDGVFICVLDEQHKEVIVGLAPLGLHIMCEKPLACSLEDCVDIYRSMLPDLPYNTTPSNIFSIGHVLRYSPHNMLLRKLLLEDKVIGEIMSINHTEPVGWWHFTHSYVRGNWRKESTTAPSLLTKSCHDIDLLLWLLCSPLNSSAPAHIPSSITSTGSLQLFNKTRKPTAARSATNCLSCPIETSCKYSAKKIYLGKELKGLASGNTNWPVDIVLPEIEEFLAVRGSSGGEEALRSKLEEDYNETTPAAEVSAKNWFGRCVWEADNDVCDDQVVTMTWDNEPFPKETDDNEKALVGRGAKTAIFHMVAHTKRICERFYHIYGSDGEIYADSSTITVEDFITGIKKTYKPHLAGGGHGGGDAGLTRQFILAIDAVKNHGAEVSNAQKEHIGCSLEEVIRSHAMVFAAEDARKNKKVINFPQWWEEEVQSSLLRPS
ncbi:NAD binding Rossmann fold oxidoreductase-like protein [Calycina marina]|uniref:NAD binding Rossmann fold oxidoreductase-like protein n=1 Tax=Calycina marina TaxID=1763456 RepID=A0A9P7Z443_9HELO|nr:NAD binding Rossmann fold oxidoreductase-like protein [Calycina marina]